jgi:hypothetical protein
MHGYFLKNDKCTKCPYHCEKCTQAGCYSCHIGSFLHDGVCLPCSKGCLDCSNKNQCEECFSPFELDDGKCVDRYEDNLGATIKQLIVGFFAFLVICGLLGKYMMTGMKTMNENFSDWEGSGGRIQRLDPEGGIDNNSIFAYDLKK